MAAFFCLPGKSHSLSFVSFLLSLQIILASLASYKMKPCDTLPVFAGSTQFWGVFAVVQTQNIHLPGFINNDMSPRIIKAQ